MFTLNIIGLKKEDIKDKEVISIKTLCSKINLSLSDNYEIILFGINDINQNDVFIDKIYSSNDCIISISFVHKIIINVSINNSVKQFYHDIYVAHSFSYSREDDDFNIYPISLDAKTINKNIQFYITYAFTECSNPNSFNQSHIVKSSTNDSITKPSSTVSSYSYIDISKEFI